MRRRTSAAKTAKGNDQTTLASLEQEMSVLVRRAIRRLWSEESESGALDRWTYAFLVRLSAGPMRVGEVARIFGIDKSTASRHLKRIVEGGLAEASVDAADARSSIVRITALGQTQLDEARTARMEPMRRVFAAWPEEDRRMLALLLARLNAELDAQTESRPKGEDTEDRGGETPRTRPV
jgi:DNA-binding MarR family transcriptional regulator